MILMEDWGGRKSYPTGTVHPRLQEMFRLHEIHYRICLAYFSPLQKLLNEEIDRRKGQKTEQKLCLARVRLRCHVLTTYAHVV